MEIINNINIPSWVFLLSIPIVIIVIYRLARSESGGIYILGIIKAWFGNTRKTTHSVVNMKKERIGRFSSKPTAQEIVKEIKKYPPGLRKTASDNYANIKVDWPVRYHTIFGKEENTVVMMKDDSGYPWIFTTVSLHEYPKLRTLHEDTPIRVKGKIQEIDEYEIRIIDSKVILD